MNGILRLAFKPNMNDSATLPALTAGLAFPCC